MRLEIKLDLEDVSSSELCVVLGSLCGELDKRGISRADHGDVVEPFTERTVGEWTIYKRGAQPVAG